MLFFHINLGEFSHHDHEEFRPWCKKFLGYIPQIIVDEKYQPFYYTYDSEIPWVALLKSKRDAVVFKLRWS